jgi:hypothetical protein
MVYEERTMILRRYRSATCCLLAGVVMLGVGLAAWGATSPGVAAHAHARPARASVQEAMHAAMQIMIQAMEAVPMRGDPDQDFLAMMIPHHEGAIEMARLALVYGRDPLVRQLAEEIIAGQQAEIAAMRGRLGLLRAVDTQDPGGFPALEGTRGPVPALAGSR